MQNDSLVVCDGVTNLSWQRSGSSDVLDYTQAQEYIHELNNQKFAGYNNWRLPTLKEAMSLMEPVKNGDLYIDSVFDQRQRSIWSADVSAVVFGVEAWLVYFEIGYCSFTDMDFFESSYALYVRAVRSGQ